MIAKPQRKAHPYASLEPDSDLLQPYRGIHADTQQKLTFITRHFKITVRFIDCGKLHAHTVHYQVVHTYSLFIITTVKS